VLILIHHIQHHRLRLEGLALGRGLELHRDLIPDFDLGRGFHHHLAVHLNQAGLDQLLQVTAGELGNMRCQRPVQALGMGCGVHGKAAELGLAADI